jgi:hypothetical protein
MPKSPLVSLTYKALFMFAVPLFLLGCYRAKGSAKDEDSNGQSSSQTDDTPTEADSDSADNPGPDGDADSDSVSLWDTDVDTDTDADTDTNTDADTDSDSDSVSPWDSDSVSPWDSDSVSQWDTDADSDSAADSDTTTATNRSTDSWRDTESIPDSDTSTEIETESATHALPDTDSETSTSTGPDSETVVDTFADTDTTIDTDSDHGLGPCRYLDSGYVMEVPEGTPCEDGNQCTEGMLCRDGECRGGALKVCNDNNPITTDFCSPFAGCLYDDECDELQINLVPDGNQSDTKTISFSDSGGLVCWLSESVGELKISFRMFDADGIGEQEERVVLPFTYLESIYGEWAGLTAVSRVGDDRFLVAWDEGTRAQRLYQIFDRNGDAVTEPLLLPEPLLPAPLPADHQLISRAYYDHCDSGFVALMENSTSPGSTNEEIYLYRFNQDGELEAGPTPVGTVLSTYGIQSLARGDSIRVLQALSGTYDIRRFDLETLGPLGDPVTMTTATSNPHLLDQAMLTPSGYVIAASNAYSGSFLYWLNEDDEKVATSTLAAGNSTFYSVGLAVYDDGHTVAVSANRSDPNGMNARFFTGVDDPAASISTVDCSMTAVNPKPRLVQLADKRVLVTWISSLTDGDGTSVRGRLLGF